MSAFFISTGIVSLAEIGDKTQLLALILAARWRCPLTIISALFLATLVNHGLAGGLGLWISHLLTPTTLSGFLLLSFLCLKSAIKRSWLPCAWSLNTSNTGPSSWGPPWVF